MNRTSVPVCRQNIRGLQNFAMKDLQNDSIVLRSLNLPIENNIDLNDLSNEGIYRFLLNNIPPTDRNAKF